jgi:hypothetical protein
MIQAEVNLINDEQQMELTDYYSDLCDTIRMDREQAWKLKKFIEEAFSFDDKE